MAHSPEPSEHDAGRVPENDGARALAHRKVLDIGRERPDASLEAVADELGDVSVSFVERVFEEFGDPADGDRWTEPPEGATARRNAVDTPPDIGHDGEVSSDGGDRSTDGGDDRGAGEPDVTPEQRAALRAVYEQPTATQTEIADRVGASRAAVSKRLNDIPGFDWKSRRAFVETLFGDGPGRPLSDRGRSEGDSESERLAALEGRIERLESAVADRPASTAAGDIETVRLTIHACLDAEHISCEEELQIVRNLVGKLR